MRVMNSVLTQPTWKLVRVIDSTFCLHDAVDQCLAIAEDRASWFCHLSILYAT